MFAHPLNRKERSSCASASSGGLGPRSSSCPPQGLMECRHWALRVLLTHRLPHSHSAFDLSFSTLIVVLVSVRLCFCYPPQGLSLATCARLANFALLANFHRLVEQLFPLFAVDDLVDGLAACVPVLVYHRWSPSTSSRTPAFELVSLNLERHRLLFQVADVYRLAVVRLDELSSSIVLNLLCAWRPSISICTRLSPHD